MVYDDNWGSNEVALSDEMKMTMTVSEGAVVVIMMNGGSLMLE